jgi:tyrosine-protein kinase Etk/Wzc
VTPRTLDDTTVFKEKEFGLLEIVRILLVHKRPILWCTFISSGIVLLISLVIRPTYTAKATFMPPRSSSSGSSLLLGELSQLSGLSNSAATSLGGLKDPGLIYIGILESRTVADDLIRQFDLQRVYKTKKLSKTEQALAKRTRFIPGKDTLITISVDDHDPKRACDIANAYLDELQKQNNRLALTEAGQRRVFFEQQLNKEKDLLANAEADLTRTEEQTGLIRPSGQAQMQIAAIAATQAAIASRQIELSALSRGATEQNPEVVRLNSEIEGLRVQLNKLEDSEIQPTPGNIEVPTAKVPELTLVYARKERETKYHEALYQFLLRQLESSKLDESRAAPLVQVVDTAVIPDTRSWPPRLLLTIAAAILGAIVGITWAFSSEALARMAHDGANAEKLDAIRRAARFKK